MLQGIHIHIWQHPEFHNQDIHIRGRQRLLRRTDSTQVWPGSIGHWWMMKTRRNRITFLVFFQEKCRAIKFNLVVETLFSFCLFDFFCSRQTNNLNMKQQPQKQ